MDKRAQRRRTIVTGVLLSAGYWVIALPIWAFTQLGDPADQTTAGVNAALATRHRVGLIVLAVQLAVYLLLLGLFMRHARRKG